MPFLSDLYIAKSGLIFVDAFIGFNSRWSISPPTSYSLTERPGFMRLKHNQNEDTLMLWDKPSSGDVAIEVIADYTPTLVTDSGGILIWRTADSKIEFVESADADVQTDEKAWLASSKGEDWNFYSRSGSDYSLKDSDTLATKKVGVILKRGNEAGSVPMDIDKIIVTTGRFLTVSGITSGTKVQLYDNSSNLIREALVQPAMSGVDIELPTLEFEGKLTIKDSSNAIITEKSATFYGGDEYGVGTTLQVRMNSVELSTNSITDIGAMTGGMRQVQLEIYNPATVAVSNVKLAVEQYLDKFGYTWADLALDVSGVPGAYSDLLTISSIPANSTKKFWLKVTKGNDYMGLETLKLNVRLMHD